MQNIEKTVSESGRAVLKLGQRSDEIGNIVKIISSLAVQSNLLALNAAIEAGRNNMTFRRMAMIEHQRSWRKMKASFSCEVQG